MKIISSNDNQYPYLLKEICDFPKHLYCYGDVTLLGKRCISIVGTRKITAYGKWVIDNLLDTFLADLDIVVVSGLALGVDAYVHKTCLDRGIKTIAVVPSSLYSSIPMQNIILQKEIMNKGLVITEHNDNVDVGKWLYVKRNRIVAGLSMDCIIIEAGLGSGSLITANFAIEYNRNVYAVPGNVNSPVSCGCNELIKQGAGLVLNSNDLKEILGLNGEQLNLTNI